MFCRIKFGEKIKVPVRTKGIEKLKITKILFEGKPELLKAVSKNFRKVQRGVLAPKNFVYQRWSDVFV